MPADPAARLAALEKVARMAARLVETIEKGEQITLRKYRGDIGNVERALAELAVIDGA